MSNKIYDLLRQSAEEKLKEKKNCKLRIVLGYSICSMSVGANEVLKELQQSLVDLELDEVLIETTGCAGLCSREPLLDVYTDNNEKYTYELVTPKKARAILVTHALYGEALEKYLIKK